MDATRRPGRFNVLTSSILVTKVGKPPDISQSYRETYQRQNEVECISPRFAFLDIAGTHRALFFPAVHSRTAQYLLEALS